MIFFCISDGFVYLKWNDEVHEDDKYVWKSALFDTSISLAILGLISVKYSLNLSAIFWHHPRVSHCSWMGWKFDFFWYRFIHDIPNLPYIVFVFCKLTGIMLFLRPIYIVWDTHCTSLDYTGYIRIKGESVAQRWSFLYKLLWFSYSCCNPGLGATNAILWLKLG